MMKPRVRVNGATGLPVKASSYDAATQGRRGKGWIAPQSGPNASLTGSLATLRNRSRAAYRNNPLISMGLNRAISNEIGTGVVPRFLSSDDKFNKAMAAAFDLWAEQCDSERTLNYYGIQTQACRARRISGECFIRLRRRSLTSGLALPLQVQVLESDFVPETYNAVLANGNKVKSGIEYNRFGQRVAYWMYPEHPHELNTDVYAGRLLRIPANDVIHHYQPTRPGQSRGEPDTVQSLLKAHTFDVYDDAELLRKQTKAPYTGFLTRDSYDEQDYLFDPFTGEAIEGGGAVPELNVQAGSILTGLPGEKLDLFQGDDTGAGYADFMKEQKLGIAAGIGLPYELMTGDWSAINDRLYRAMINEYRREVEALQDQITIYQCCKRIVDWSINAAVTSQIVIASGYETKKNDYHKVEHRPQGWQHIHPEQDVNAALKAIEGGLKSRDRVVASTGGWDAADVDRQNVEAEKRLKELREKAGLKTDQEK
jgi:lambda family phage portal protein